ncbi:MAG: hypothetical protein FJX74_09500 [Armatimonadetes bacterium]|nr:hypothetical protein [Armatimonadota bacterium]
MNAKPATIAARMMAARAATLSGAPRVSCPFCATSVPGWRIGKTLQIPFLYGEEIVDVPEVVELKAQVASTGSGACPWCGEEIDEAKLEAAVGRVTLFASIGKPGPKPWEVDAPTRPGTSLFDRLERDLYRPSSDTVSGSSLGTKR